MSISRAVIQGRQVQGEDEQIVYKITTTPWGTSPSAVSVVAKDLSNNNTDVSATVLSGAASVLGDVITLPILKSLTAGHLYRIEIKFTTGGNVLETYAEVLAET